MLSYNCLMTCQGTGRDIHLPCSLASIWAEWDEKMKEKEDSVPKMCSFYTSLKFHVTSPLGKAAESVRKGQKIGARGPHGICAVLSYPWGEVVPTAMLHCDTFS